MNRLLTLGLMACSFPLLASGHFQVNEHLSTVNFASIKKQYIVEPAVISGVSGKIDEKGRLEITVPLNTLDTGVSIRNERLRAMFFDEKRFPSVNVTATVPEQLMGDEDLAIQKMLPATVELYGQSKELIFTVNIVKSGGHLMVSTAKPTVISGFDFGIPKESLDSVSNTVGDIALSPNVPVNFSLVLEKR
ncbi:YceI family protein [Vibrio pelagius]|uniref:YceI family protein n=1 Tax=Vibrio pelagius TaxID=28169 RepID=UPI0021C268BB|nr:YceI family protein [Vibrio pelagius]